MALPNNLPQTDYIQGFWKLDEESGTRADETDNNNDLTDNNTVGYSSSGKIGNAADFEYDNSEYLSITDGDQTGLDITGDLSICCWIKPETSLGIETRPLVAKYIWGASNNRSYVIVLNRTHTIRTYGSDDGTDDTGHFWDKTTTGTISDGTWGHISLVLDASEQKMYIYLNGVADVDGEDSIVTSIFDSTAPFEIGSYDNHSLRMDGLIDEVIVWNTALTADEISDVYDITEYEYASAGMFNWWFIKDSIDKGKKYFKNRGLWLPEPLTI